MWESRNREIFSYQWLLPVVRSEGGPAICLRYQRVTKVLSNDKVHLRKNHKVSLFSGGAAMNVTHKGPFRTCEPVLGLPGLHQAGRRTAAVYRWSSAVPRSLSSIETRRNQFSCVHCPPEGQRHTFHRWSGAPVFFLIFFSGICAPGGPWKPSSASFE